MAADICGSSITPIPDVVPVITYICQREAGHEGSHGDNMKARRAPDGDYADRANTVIVEFPAQQYAWDG